jgi:ABC-2 type transport system ATP-binding protein
VAENLRLFARLERVDDVERAVARMLEQTALHDRADDEVGKLSGGNRQRVNIAIGLLGDPGVLLLDEPSSALDPRQRERLWQFIAGLGTTVVFSTHDVGEAERYADRLLVLADGELLFTGTPAELNEAANADADLETAFVRFLHERGH